VEQQQMADTRERARTVIPHPVEPEWDDEGDLGPHRSPWWRRLGWTAALLTAIVLMAGGGYVAGRNLAPGGDRSTSAAATPTPAASPTPTSSFGSVRVDGGLAQADVAARFSAAGISSRSTGNCTDRARPECTSFDGLRPATVDGVVMLAQSSGCPITVTGGTEVGHAPGTYSHETGYKVNLQATDCLTAYLTGRFRRVTDRQSDGAAQYLSQAGNVYAQTGTGWDAQFGVPDSEPLP
jgi:hypothetical protein